MDIARTRQSTGERRGTSATRSARRRASIEAANPEEAVLEMQRTAGNAAVMSLLAVQRDDKDERERNRRTGSAQPAESSPR